MRKPNLLDRLLDWMGENSGIGMAAIFVGVVAVFIYLVILILE